jgi:hypothetical protein
MMNPTDCDVRFATHARRIAQVNDHEWLRPQRATATPQTKVAGLGTTLMALVARLVHRPLHTRVDLAGSGD